MFHTQRSFYGLAVAAVLLISLLSQVHGLTLTYCSTLNTGSGGGNYSDYQSNGLCKTFCDNSYALAIVQSNYCWCSNYVPATTESISNCADPCPGYPPESCGGQGTYGYILLGSPSGTEGSASSTTAASSSPVTPTNTSPIVVTILSTATVTETRAAPSSSSTTKSSITPDPPSTSDSTTSTSTSENQPSTTTPLSTSSTWTPTPSISLQTITGQVHTVTVTPTAPPTSQNDPGTSTRKSSGGLGTGGAVGLTIGLVALAALVAGIIYFCWRKRKQGAEGEDGSRDSATTGLSGPVPSRTMSEHSRFVLGTDGTRVVETWEPVEPTATHNSSGFMPVDPRLDPFAPVYQRGEGNKSRESLNTIQDDRDYSRRVHQPGGGRILRTTNPD